MHSGGDRLIFNGLDMAPYMRIIDIRGRGVAGQEITTLRPTGSSLDHITYVTSSSKSIEIDFEIRAADRESLREKIDAVSAIISTKERVPVIFPDERDMTYYCILADAEQITEYHHLGIHRGTLYLLGEAYKYGKEEEEPFQSDILNLQYNGTAEASPIFELEVLKPVTFAMVQNQYDEYQLIGTPLEADTEIADNRELLIEERGQTLDTWNDQPTKVDGGVVAGRLSTDNDGITVPSYGADTKTGWHGPALIKEVPPVQDFEVEMMVEGEALPNMTYRIEFYTYDENMNVLGKMALLDKSLGINRKIAEGRIGDYEGRRQNYLISSQNYSYGWPFFFGMLRMRRIGKTFEFYVTRVSNDTKHVYSLKKLFTDNNNEYMGKLRYVQIHIGKYADTARANAPKINHIKVYELAQATVDQTPYIAYPNDIITFGHENEEILINGEDATELKALGASYFALAKGENQLIVHPANSFNTRVKWCDKYR